jgi:hypothetical protein
MIPRLSKVAISQHFHMSALFSCSMYLAAIGSLVLSLDQYL